jgi:phage terminase large subunit-like protein
MVTSSKALVTSALQGFREHQEAVTEFRMQKATENEFLRDLILNESRIDLLMTEVLGYEIKDFHEVMFDAVQNNSFVIANTLDKRQLWNLTLAPRGFGKSTCLNIARCILKILQNPNIRILIASKTDTNAVSFLSEIKQKLLRPKMVEVFGVQQGSPWNDGSIRVRARTADSKEDTIETIGIGGAIASKHYDLIIADDLIDESNSITETQREKIHTWFFKVLDPCLEPHGEMSVIGTRYNPDDLYGYLMENVLCQKDHRGKVTRQHYISIPALIEKPNMDSRAPESERYLSLWPEKCSVKFLLKKRKVLGTIIFNTQYQNDVAAMKGKIFKLEWFRYYKTVDLNELKIYQGVDLASKQAKNADRFAHATIGVHIETKKIYILNYHNIVATFGQRKSIVAEEFFRFDPIRVGIEANGYQRAFIQDLAQDDEFKSIRAIPVFTEKDKVSRAWKLSAFFERRQVHVKEEMQDLIEHLLKFPDGRYKDLFDALDLAITVAFAGKRRQRPSEPGLI